MHLCKEKTKAANVIEINFKRARSKKNFFSVSKIDLGRKRIKNCNNSVAFYVFSSIDMKFIRNHVTGAKALLQKSKNPIFGCTQLEYTLTALIIKMQ